MKFFYIPFHFIFTAELWFQCFQLQAALHVISGKCSTKNAARGAAKLSIGCVWLSCLNFSFWKVHLLTSFIPFLAQTVDIWTWLYLLCLLYACYFNLQTCNGIVSKASFASHHEPRSKITQPHSDLVTQTWTINRHLMIQTLLLMTHFISDTIKSFVSTLLKSDCRSR